MRSYLQPYDPAGGPPQAADLRRELADALFSASGADLIADAPEIIAKATGADVVLVSRLHERAGLLETLQMFDAHGRVAHYAYKIADTPCEIVATSRAPTAFPRELQRLFPKDVDLSTLDLYAYAGAPLLDEDGRFFGLVCALWSREAPEASQVAAAIGSIAPRLARDAARRIRAAAHDLWDRAAEQGLWLADLRAQVTTLTPKARDLTARPGDVRFERDSDLPFDWVAPNERATVACSLARHIETGEPFDVVCRAPAGSRAHWLRMVGAAQFDAEGKVETIAGSVSDVTELVEAREAASAARAAQSAFLANMSHEMRTPLNGVVALASMLARTETDPRRREMATLIQSSAETLERLVSDMLDMARIEAGKVSLEPAPFDLVPAIESAIGGLREAALAKGLAFRSSASPRACGSFVGDLVRIRQIVVNFVSNAVKFTQSGAIDITIDAPTDANGRDWVEIAVRDTGIGFDPSQAERLFRRFEQADDFARRRGGTGLGLAICKSLVDMMAGEISARSTVGVGSQFVVRLPLPRVEASAPESQIDALPPIGGLRVLLAEDNPVNRRVISLILEPLGAELVCVGDGAAAVEAAKAGEFDVILMDTRMPVMDGLAATRAIRALPHAGHVPILMLSADALPEHVAHSLDAGCNAHVAKPITPARLLTALAEHVPCLQPSAAA